MKCPACGSENAEGLDWCDFCKEPFKKGGKKPGSAGGPPPSKKKEEEGPEKISYHIPKDTKPELKPRAEGLGEPPGASRRHIQYPGSGRIPEPPPQPEETEEEGWFSVALDWMRGYIWYVLFLLIVVIAIMGAYLLKTLKSRSWKDLDKIGSTSRPSMARTIGPGTLGRLGRAQEGIFRRQASAMWSAESPYLA